MTSFRVYDNLEPIEFDGVLLGEGSTETEDAVRWTEVSIYRTDTGRYVINRSGRSVVYHVHQGTCNTGVPRPMDELSEDAQPCTKCRPSLHDRIVAMELDFDTTEDCEAGEVYDRLLLHRVDKNTGRRTSFLSNPAARAYEQACRADPALATSRAPRRVG